MNSTIFVSENEGMMISMYVCFYSVSWILRFWGGFRTREVERYYLFI